MADLDDFFAKKDRKKTKAKKFGTPDELVKKLEDTTKKTEVKTARKEPQSSSLPSTQSDGVEIETADQLPAPEVCVSSHFIFILPRCTRLFLINRIEFVWCCFFCPS